MGTEQEAPISAPVPYFGGKRALAPLIVSLLTRGGKTRARRYFEGFHGSAAVLLELRRRGFDGLAIVNDRLALVSNLMRVLAHPAGAAFLLERVARTPFHEDLFIGAREALRTACKGEVDCDALLRAAGGDWAEGPPNPTPSEFQVEVAFHYLLTLWMGSNDMAGLRDTWDQHEGRFSARYTSTGGDPAWASGKVLASIPEWHRLLNAPVTEFMCRDVFDCFASVPDGPDLIAYFDPPYVHQTRGNRRYALDVDDATGGFREDEDFHARVAERIRGYAGARVVVSYYEHERVRRLYPKPWVVMSARELGQTVNKNSGRGEAPEVFAMNFDPREEASGG